MRARMDKADTKNIAVSNTISGTERLRGYETQPARLIGSDVCDH
jgi:hypothetical protein